MKKLSVRSLEVEGKRVLTRVDLNVPLADGGVADDTRIQAVLPTVRLLRDRGARVVLMSHLGRPKGERRPELSLAPVAAHLGLLLGEGVGIAPDSIGDEVEHMTRALEPGEVLLLENLRFHPGEEKNDDSHAQALARMGDAYVNDAFGSAHRAHASTVGVAKLLGPAACGLLMERELDALGAIMSDPAHPFVAILGGAKISGKIDVIENLLPRVDSLLIGGGMMFTFLRAMGLSVGKSLVETDRIEMASSLLASAGEKIILPVDCRVAHSIDAAEEPDEIMADEIPDDMAGVDIGAATIELFAGHLAEARTIFWNGPLGVFEVDAYAQGTLEVARLVGVATGRGATSVIGGGDSVAAIKRSGHADDVTHLSTGGGATLEFIEGKELPGVAVLAEA
ncbi:MAG: phosphoglycerate kinase [Candidatus Eiseniibacteriota bacterium]